MAEQFVEQPTSNPLAAIDAQAEQTGAIKEIVTFVTDNYQRLRDNRINKEDIWTECWELYRGKQDFTNKEDWNSQIVLPKSFNSVKQATSTIERFLSISRSPWSVAPVNPDDLRMAVRAGQIAQLTEVFLDNAQYKDAFSTGLESGFITGLGIWKLWWELAERPRLTVQNGQTATQTVQEGRLRVKAVDPYNFFWLPGSKLNDWKGTIELVRMPKWELLEQAKKGLFNLASPDVVRGLSSSSVRDSRDQTMIRFDEYQTNPTHKDEVELLEYYGPIIRNNEVIEPYGHVIVANRSKLLSFRRYGLWSRKFPYVAFSPLSVPFRTEGVGLVEMVREIDKALNKLANMSMDTLLFRLMPIFEVYPDMFENEEDLRTGLVPGKFFMRSMTDLSGTQAIRPIPTEDISAGAIQLVGLLDRSHQEGSLVSEVQQPMPRWRGVTTATEIDKKVAQQDTFFGNLAASIENNALKPMVELSIDLIMQYLDTSRDPRVPAILGVNAPAVQSIPREQLVDMLDGEYVVKVTGISNQIKNVEVLQHLVQFMNILSQNAEAWLPYVRQDVLLRKILAAFRAEIPDIEDIIETPEVAAAKLQAFGVKKVTPEMLKALPGIMQAEAKRQQGLAALQQRQALLAKQEQRADEDHSIQLLKIMTELELEARRVAIEEERVKQEGKRAKT